MGNGENSGSAASPSHKTTRNWLKRTARTRAVCAAIAVMALPVWPQENPKDLASESLEDLMNMEVTSVSKKEEKLSRTAAAVFVITQEDIRRSGATTIPDLLRMVPGMDVGEINGSTWAVSARGFNSQFSNKLMVMIDGRSVYTPYFAGVYWDTATLPLEDIERIEVIRGPGGTVWGANAVNGVINIITKKASETRGITVEAGGGNQEQGSGYVQYGKRLDNKTDATFYTKYFNRRDMPGLDGGDGGDGWHLMESGFRSDSQLTAKDSLTMEGNLYAGREGELGFVLPDVTSPQYVAVPEVIALDGGFFQAAWDHKYSERADSELEVSFTRSDREDPQEPETRDTLEAEYKVHAAWGKRQDVVTGVGYEVSADDIGGSLTVSFNPPSRTLQWVNAFVQDEVAVVNDRLYVTLGTKFGHNDYTGFEFMPSARVAWTPAKNETVWAAVSRALRTPSRNDTNLVVNDGSTTAPDGTLVLTRFLGNPDFQNERLIAYEAGYRQAFGDRFTVDIATYYNDYDSLQTTEPSASFFENSPAPPHEVQTLTYENLMYGETHGVEAAINWKATKRWTLSPGYALEELHMHTQASSEDAVTRGFVENGAPRHSAQLRSHVDLGKGVEWNAAVYFVDRLSDQGLMTDQVIPAYTRLDTGLAWRFGEHFSASIVGQNLLKDHHLEFEDTFGSMQSGEIKRTGYIQLRWQF